MKVNDQSRIYKELEGFELERIVSHVFGPDTVIIESRLLGGGLFNTTYYLAVSNPLRQFVLRVAPIRTELLFDFEKTMMGVEKHLYDKLEQVGVPVPNVIFYDNSRKVIDREYQLAEFVSNSVTFNDPSFPEEQRERIQSELGKITARIHSIHAVKFGWPQPDGTVDGHDNWPDELARFCSEIAERCREHGVVEEADLVSFERYLQDNRALFELSEPPCLIHNDLWAQNILVRSDDHGNWEVAAIIDVDRAMYADREFEFALWSNDPHFMEGYGCQLGMTLEAKKKRVYYEVVVGLFSAYVYKVQYDNTQDFENSKKRALDGLRRLYEIKSVGLGRNKPVRLRCEYVHEPIGIDTERPRFSWEFEFAERNWIQGAYRILVSDSKERVETGSGDYWDSGRVNSKDTLQIEYSGKPLESGKRYYWTVECFDSEGGSGGPAETASFRMGLLRGEDWIGQWIGADEEISSPLFRRLFSLNKPVHQATAYIAGLGYYELSCNGRKVGDHVLDPNWTDFDDRTIEGLLYPFDDQTSKRVHYIVYEMIDWLQSGENAIGVMLGNGFYNQTERTIEGRMRYGSPRFLFQLKIEYEDGTLEWIVSDDRWTCSQGPITFNNVFLGETYDARLEQEEWDSPGFDDSMWMQAQPVRKPTGRLVSQLSPADKIRGYLTPIQRKELEPGIYIFDMGQNFSGWVRIAVNGPAGTCVTLRFAEEIAASGELDVTSCGGGDQVQTDRYILKGRGMEVYEPRFAWHGFRYVEVSGYPGVPELYDLEGVVVHSAVEEVGSFACSDTLLNQIQHLYRWSQLSNLHGGVPSDCPHRERLGYTGDGQVTAEAAMFNFDMSAFYSKWVNDIRDSQNKESGFVPHTAPFNGGGGGPAWGSAYVIVPWQMYKMYGDRRILEENYTGMQQWTSYLADRTDRGGIVLYEEPGSWFLGDWCLPGDIELPPVLVNTFYYAYVIGLMIQIADVLGRTEDRDHYRQMLEGTISAFNEEFLDRHKACYSIGRQGTEVFPFVLGCVPAELEERVWARLLRHYTVDLAGHLDTGIFGTAFLFDLLSNRRETDTALTILGKKDYPSYGFMIEQGATTLWERWDGLESHNHPMFGSVSAWFYRVVAGLAPHPDAVAFDKAELRPFCSNKLDYAKASVHTIRGHYSIHWSRSENGGCVEVAIPSNCSAELYFPLELAGATVELIEEGGQKLWSRKKESSVSGGDFCCKQEHNHLKLALGSGVYSFRICTTP